MNRLISKVNSGLRRKHRVRTTVRGTTERPRLSVNVSNRHVSAQIIDDSKHLTLVGVTTASKKHAGTLTEQATWVGQEIGKKAKTKKIKAVAFDRGSHLYHGRVKALADAARAEGLEF
jgi:large subunit ribosomal protein L18